MAQNKLNNSSVPTNTATHTPDRKGQNIIHLDFARQNRSRNLSVEEQHALILEHRESARKVARTILRKWNVVMGADEIDSAADLALCEAAHGYRPKASATFMTYLFYFIKGCLSRAIHSNLSASCSTLLGESNSDHISCPDPDDDHRTPAVERRTSSSQEEENYAAPDKVLYLSELQGRCRQALES